MNMNSYTFKESNGNILVIPPEMERPLGSDNLKTTTGHLYDDIIYYYDQNPSGFSFLVQIRAFVIYISLGLPNLNMKRKTKRILVVVVK